MAPNYNTAINIWQNSNSRIISANDSSTHTNERNKCDNIYHSQIHSLPDSSTNWKNSKNHSSLDPFEPAKVAAENNRSAVDATILLEIVRTMMKRIDNLRLVLEGVSAQLTRPETITHHLESSMDDLKVSIENNHGITDGKLRLLENILSENYSCLDIIEPAKVAVENDRSAVDATILFEIDQTMKKHTYSLHLVLEGVLARLTQLETRTHHLESSMDDLKVSVENNHGITDGKLRLLENILSEEAYDQEGVLARLTQLETRTHHLESSMDDLKVSVENNQGITYGILGLLENILSEVQNVKDKQDILKVQLETQTSDISNLVQQASSVSASALLQSQQYLPQSIYVVSPAIAPPQHGLPSPIQLPNQFAQIPRPTVPQRDPYLPPLVHSQEIPNQQYQLPLTQQPRSQPGLLYQQYQQTPHSQYSQPAPHLPQQQPPHSFENQPQLQSSMGHRLEEPPYAPSQNYPPNLHHPPSQPHSRPQQFHGTPPQGYEPLSSISGASYSSGYGTLSGPAEPNRYGRPPQYGTPPQGYESPSSRFGANYSSRYDTLSEIAEPNRYGGPPQYGGKQPQLHTASVAYISGSGYPQPPTAHVLPQAIPTESAVSVGSGSPGAGNRVSVDDVVEKVATMGFPRDHVRAMVQKLLENILILLFLYHLFLFLG